MSRVCRRLFPRDKSLSDIFSRRASAPCAGLLLCLMHTFPLRSPPPQAFPGFQKNIRTAYRHFSLFLIFFKKVLAFCFSLCYNNQAPGSRGTKMNKGAFPSGQWGQTVNLLLNASVVRIHQLPPKNDKFRLVVFIFPCYPNSAINILCSEQNDLSAPLQNIVLSSRSIISLNRFSENPEISKKIGFPY